jgi:hypothetical protein
LPRNKKATLIALFLLFAMTISLVALPNANAQTRVHTYSYLGVVPNPVGVNQGVIFHVGITKELYSSEMGWEGITITIKRPDGVTDTLNVHKTDATGGTGVNYMPTIAGNYTCQSHFPEQTTSATKMAGGFFTTAFPAGTIMLASNSAEVTLVVQEEPRPYYPYYPLPTEYWTRPIDSQQRTWIAIAGNWLEGTPVNYLAEGNDYAPETAHVLWAKPETNGGLAGAPQTEEEAIPFEHGDAYEGKFASRFIVGGRLIYNIFAGPSNGVVDIYREYKCIDLHTGEELWDKVLLDNLTISFCQLMYWKTYDYMGVYDYLWCQANAPGAYGAGTLGTYAFLGLDASTAGTTYCAFDSWTGQFVYAMYGLPSGTRVMSSKGEWLIYTVDLTHGWMTMWNSSNIPQLYNSLTFASMGWGQWRPYGKVVNATGPANVNFGTGFPPPPYIAPTTPLDLAGYQWNKTIADMPGARAVPGSVTKIFEGDRVIGGSIDYTAVRLWGLNLNTSTGDIGDLLFNHTWTAPAYWAADNLTVSGFAAGWMCWSQESMVGVMWIRESREHYGFSLETGDYMWGPTEPQYYLDSIEDVVADVRAIAYDKLYCASVSGIVYCYDVKNGTRLWSYAAKNPYAGDFLWSNNWWMKLVMITDGKVYCGTTEHSANPPMPRGGPFICLNATTGEVIWRVNGMFRQTRWGGKGLIGDSIIATQDTYDLRIYAIGKGPSATTVSAGPEGSVLGSSVIVKGMVTDISPGTEDYSLRARFPNGVPAMADENQSDWMLYVYKQFPRPTDLVGVEVVLTVMDPNNNPYEIGRATSDENGFYSVTFTPPVPGKYTVYASFDGSKAYYGSAAQTAITVDDAPAETPPPPATPAPMTDTYVMGFGIALLIAIIVVGLLLFLLLRRR